MVVLSPQCDTSTAMPTAFICATIVAPYSVIPVSAEVILPRCGSASCTSTGTRAGRALEEVDVVHRAEVGGVLDADQNADLSRSLTVRRCSGVSMRVKYLLLPAIMEFTELQKFTTPG